jgi:predicted ester cyclase
MKFLSDLRTFFPDIHVTIEDILGEGDLVATRTHCTFTSAGPNPKNVAMVGSILDRFRGGKIAETWELYDRFDLYQQLGITPPKPVI